MAAHAHLKNEFTEDKKRQNLMTWLCYVLQANAIGRSAKTVREFLEKHYTEEVAANDKECIKLALKALLEVVQTGGKNVELAIMKRGEPLKVGKESEHKYSELRFQLQYMFCQESFDFRCHPNKFIV